MVQEMARQPVRVIRVRKLVLEQRDLDSRAARCRYIEEFRRDVNALECFENDAVVNVEALIEAGIVKNPKDGVKILGNGELTKKLTVQANAFSAGAVAKIEAAGGKAEVI